jgi:hypothetical protein
VLAAVGSWERLIDDLTAAAVEPVWKGPGGHRTCRKHWPNTVDAHLLDCGVIGEPVTTRWEVAYPAGGWRGKSGRGWRTVLRQSPTAERQHLLSYIAETRRARNGAAHYALLQNAHQSAVDADEGGWYQWKSDAEEPSLQSGYARSVASVFLQLIDCTITLVANDQNWKATPHRLPRDWFRPEAHNDRFAGVKLWAGATLHRATV